MKVILEKLQNENNKGRYVKVVIAKTKKIFIFRVDTLVYQHFFLKENYMQMRQPVLLEYLLVIINILLEYHKIVVKLLNFFWFLKVPEKCFRSWFPRRDSSCSTRATLCICPHSKSPEFPIDFIYY